jgi:NADPH:quinone reductase-like Zn-dependent oxidoreductase
VVPVRAVVVPRFGDPDVVEIGDAPLPTCPGGEVLVRVDFGGLGPWDAARRRGELGGELPYIPGAEFAGTVAGDSGDAAGFHDGEPVYGFPGLTGCHAEYVACPAEALAPLPAVISPADAAGTPVPALTAEHGLTEVLKVRPRDRVLITAAAGALGHFAVQLARLAGAEVVATAAARDHEFVHRLGAVEVVDHDDPDWPERVRTLPRGRPTQVLVCSRSTVAAAARAAAPGGVIATPVGGPLPEGGEATWQRYTARPSGAHLIRLAPRFSDGSLVVELGRRFDWRDTAESHRYVEDDEVRGTVVLEIGDA